MTDYDHDKIAERISEARFRSYLAESDNTADALELYRWNAAMASAMFELVGHVEVVLRNTVDKALRASTSEDERGIPWFMLRIPKVTTKLDTPEWDDVDGDRDSALASLSLGFWSKLIGVAKIWDDLKAGFVPGCDHTELTQRTTRAWALRNTLAHHGSMLDVDVTAEFENLLALADLIGPDVRPWLVNLERVTEVNRRRPNTVPDTVLIPASVAWPTYQAVAAYVCQPGRSFRTVKRLAFYYQGQIMPQVPQVISRRDDVPWTKEEAERLRSSGSSEDVHLARVIEHTLKHGWTGPTQQVFLLTRPDQTADGHRTISRPVVHEGSGRGSAFVHKQRYFHLSDLASASTTADLPKSYFLSDPLPEAEAETLDN